MKGSFLEGLIFGGACPRKEICVSKSIGLALVESKFTVFALFYFVFESNFQVQAPWGLIFGGAILRMVFCVLYMEGLIFGLLR